MYFLEGLFEFSNQDYNIPVFFWWGLGVGGGRGG